MRSDALNGARAKPFNVYMQQQCDKLSLIIQKYHLLIPLVHSFTVSINMGFLDGECFGFKVSLRTNV